MARGPGRWLAIVATAALVLAASTLLVAIASDPSVGVNDPAPIYLVAVVLVGVLFGTWPAVATAIAGFVLFDVLFVPPRFTLTVEDPREWLDLVVLLFVGVAIGRLSAVQGERASEASIRARESQALFRISRTLTQATTVRETLPAVMAILVDETGMDRVWVTRQGSTGERLVADSAVGPPVHAGAVQHVLARTPGDEPARWVRAHQADVRRGERAAGPAVDQYRVRAVADDVPLGSLWAQRHRSHEVPTREQTRVLALAADQIAQAYRREDLALAANAMEIARQSDALKGALLDSVSHDLRTPLASIRAAAGSLSDPDVAASDEERRSAARAIDLEATRLDRLVRNLLDLSRIEGGALRPVLEPFDLESLVAAVVDRLRSTVGQGTISIAIPDGLPPVRVDDVYFDQALTNLLENATRHAAGAPIRIRAAEHDEGRVQLHVEDGGGGAAPEAMDRLFEKFYRVPRSGEGSRRGLGIGLSVVKGMVEAMGGSVRAAQSPLGGLDVVLTLTAAPAPPAEVVAPPTEALALPAEPAPPTEPGPPVDLPGPPAEALA